MDSQNIVIYFIFCLFTFLFSILLLFQNTVIYFIFCLFTFLFSILILFRLSSLISSTSTSAQTFCPSEYIIMFLSSPRAKCAGLKGLRANRGKPRKMTPSSETEIFGGAPNGKVVAPGILVICPVDKNCDYHTKKRLFAPNIQIFGSKKHIFAPSG